MLRSLDSNKVKTRSGRVKKLHLYNNAGDASDYGYSFEPALSILIKGLCLYILVPGSLLPLS